MWFCDQCDGGGFLIVELARDSYEESYKKCWDCDGKGHILCEGCEYFAAEVEAGDLKLCEPCLEREER